MVVGALVGGVSEWINNTLNGRETTASEVEKAAALGGVLGLAGGFGEYGFSEGAGGLGFGPAIDIGAKDAFDLALGTIATASANVLGP